MKRVRGIAKNLAKDILNLKYKDKYKYKDVLKELIYLFLAYAYVTGKGDIVYVTSKKIAHFYYLILGVRIRVYGHVLSEAINELDFKNIEVIKSVRDEGPKKGTSRKIKYFIKRRELFSKPRVRAYVRLLSGS